MIIDTFLNLIFYSLQGFLNLLPGLTIFPDSFEQAWDFVATSFAQFLWILDPGMASVIVIGLQTIIYVTMVWFMVKLFTWIWGLIRG